MGRKRSIERLKIARRNMIRRCNNPKDDSFPYYGKRGIRVCDEWLEDRESFFDWAFNNGYSDDLSIDRIDVDGNYEPDNCRWATEKEQHNNRRDNVFITHDGVTKTIGEWCDLMGVSYVVRATAYKRSSSYGATTFDELFCDDLRSHRKEKEPPVKHVCCLCKRTESTKWRIGLCANCYACVLRWSKADGKTTREYLACSVAEQSGNSGQLKYNPEDVDPKDVEFGE